MTRRFGAGKVTAFSVAMTACALFGFSVSRSFTALWLFAVPYGLGAGSVDAALNNYVALHFASRHMSWLHCMWGIGATVGPYLMGATLAAGHGWDSGYRIIGFLQTVLTLILILSLPLWRRQDSSISEQAGDRALSPLDVLLLPGAKSSMICFFCYCALEQTVNLWASSYLVVCEGIEPIRAAGFGGLFFVGITAGRGLSGFFTYLLNDDRMVLLGQGIIALGILAIFLPLGPFSAYIGLITVGLGCAPIYPSLIHATPGHFGAYHSQAVIGMEMACAYVGMSCMPPCFGFLADFTGLLFFSRVSVFAALGYVFLFSETNEGNKLRLIFIFNIFQN